MRTLWPEEAYHLATSTRKESTMDNTQPPPPNQSDAVDALVAMSKSPFDAVLAVLMKVAVDEYGRGGFVQYTVLDEEGERWGVTTGLDDSE